MSFVTSILSITALGAVLWLLLRILNLVGDVLDRYKHEKAASVIINVGVLIILVFVLGVTGLVADYAGMGTAIFLTIFTFVMGALVIEPIFWICKRIVRKT
jgi:hypothetical protein